MPETVRSRAEQDAIVLAIYASAIRQAKELVPGSYRDDVVQILMVDCLKSLRYGLWADPPEGLDAFVEDSLRRRRTSHRRKRLRRMIRDFEQVTALSGMENEWMSSEHAVEEDRLSGFVRRVYRRLPSLWVRAHKLIRVEHLTYAEALHNRGLRFGPRKSRWDRVRCRLGAELSTRRVHCGPAPYRANSYRSSGRWAVWATLRERTTADTRTRVRSRVRVAATSLNHPLFRPS